MLRRTRWRIVERPLKFWSIRLQRRWWWLPMWITVSTYPKWGREKAEADLLIRVGDRPDEIVLKTEADVRTRELDRDRW